MGKKIIQFNAPAWLMVFLGAIKQALKVLTVLGVGGQVVESQFQFKPWATLVFLFSHEFIGFVMRAYINQELRDDDK